MTESTQAPANDRQDPDGAETTAASSPLVERYVAVTLGHVPITQRQAVEPPLREAIVSEVAHRYDRLLGDENTTWDDLEVDVLEDMGDPERVAAAMTNRPLFLIGPRYFLDFKHVLLWLLVIVSPVAAALSVVSSAQEGATVAWMVVDGVVAAVTAALYASALTTLGFAVAEQISRPKAEVVSAAWTIDKLPNAPLTRISASQTATTVVVSLLLAIAIVWQQMWPSLFTQQSEAIPFLNPAHWPWLWCGLVGLLAIEALAAIGRHVRGFWTYTWAAVNLLVVSAIAGTLVWTLLDHTFLNDAFFDAVGWPTGELPTETLETWTAGVIAVLWATSVTLGFVRAARARAALQD